MPGRKQAQLPNLRVVVAGCGKNTTIEYVPRLKVKAHTFQMLERT
jgi:hypothetical protein